MYDWESYVRELLGTPPTQIEEVQFGRHNQVFKAQLDAQPVIIRVPKDDHYYPAEVAAMQLLCERNFPVPQVIGYSITPPIMVLSALPGKMAEEAAASPVEETAFFTDAGRWLAKMHELKLPGFGTFAASLEGHYATWRSFWQEFTASKIVYAEEEGLLTAEQLPFLHQQQNLILAGSLAQGVFLHGDFGTSNFLVEGDHISGILDFSDAIIGDPHYDVARALYYQITDQQASFRAGYPHPLDEELLMAHVVVLAVMKAVYHHRRDSEKKMACAVQLFEEVRTTGSFGNTDCVV